MELFLNGEPLWPKQRKPMELPPDWETSPMIVRLGRYYFDDTPLIGKIVDFNMWDRLAMIIYLLQIKNVKLNLNIKIVDFRGDEKIHQLYSS